MNIITDIFMCVQKDIRRVHTGQLKLLLFILYALKHYAYAVKRKRDRAKYELIELSLGIMFNERIKYEVFMLNLVSVFIVNKYQQGIKIQII